MNSAQSPTVPAVAGADVDEVRLLVTTATQRLLGDTISVTDEDWHSASRLPGWTRAHLATHLARQADALVRVAQGAIGGQPQAMYGSAEQREAEIEAGAHRGGLELQVDLDKSANALSDAFERVEQADAWDTPVQLRGGQQVPARLLPLARLCEVVLHHIDLDTGFGVSDIDQRTADWLLEWCAFRLRNRNDFPALQLTSDSGFTLRVGSVGEATVVTGGSAELLAWLAGRGTGESLSGTEGVTVPAFG